MTTISNQVKADRIKLPFQFDVVKMTAEFEALKLKNFNYYDVISLRSPAHLVDPSLPAPPPADDYADGSWTDWLNTEELKMSPYFQSVIDTFRQHTTVNLVRLLRLAPQAVVKEHTDPTLGLDVHKSMIRLTIPVINNEHVEFILDGSTVPMSVGECWYLNLTRPHLVNNFGLEERVNLSIDMIPNDWVRQLIADAKV